MWEKDGHAFRQAVAEKHLPGRDAVTEFETIYRHFEQNPPPLLTTAREIIAYLMHSIDDPSVEPPKVHPFVEQENEVVVTWRPSTGWVYSESAIRHILKCMEEHVSYLGQIGLPETSETILTWDDLDQFATGYDLSQLGINNWLGAYAKKHNMTFNELVHQIEKKEEEYQAKKAEEADQGSKWTHPGTEVEHHQPSSETAPAAPDSQEAQRALAIENASQNARRIAEEILGSVSEDECDCLLADHGSAAKAIKYVESRLRIRHVSGDNYEPPVSMEEAVERVRSEISEDCRRWKQERSAREARDVDYKVKPPTKIAPSADGLRHQSPDNPPTNWQHALIKWTGSKRRQAKQIVAEFPRRIETYFEPFLGGASILFELLGSDIEVRRFECSDICEPLIELWKLVRDDPRGLVDEYAKNWRMLQAYGADHFKRVRREFNLGGNPHDLFLLLRTCRAGHVRFNQAGEFNANFHAANPGMAPETVELLVNEWQGRLADRDITFVARDYRQISPKEGDLLYLDPPYETGAGRYYYGPFNHDELFAWLRKQPCGYLLSLNGFVGGEDRRLDVPKDLYDEQIPIENGECAIDRLVGREPRLVTESLYIRWRGNRGAASSE
jgi:DNA adenine methylase